MPHRVQGVVARAKGQPVELTTIVVPDPDPDPGPGEALVQVQACGVCHTYLHYREGGINDDFPFLLGHEAAGFVAAVGDDVTHVQPGDFVVLNWRAVCGVCRSCARGRPWLCFDTHNAAQPMTLEDGTALSPALGVGAFAEKTLVHAGRLGRHGRPRGRSHSHDGAGDPAQVFGHGGATKSSWYGDCLPSRDFPLLVDLWQQGRFPLDAFVSERIALADVEAAFGAMERGDVLRSVVVL